MATKDINSIILQQNIFKIDELSINTTHFGNIAVDTAGFESVEVLFFNHFLSVVDGDYELILLHGDTNVVGNHSTVPSNEFLGSPLKIVEADGNDNLLRGGYVGQKRFLSAHIVSTIIAGGGELLGAFIILNTPRRAPTSALP